MTTDSGSFQASSESGHEQADQPTDALSTHDRQLLIELERMHHQTSPVSNGPEKDLIQRTLQALTLAGLGLYGAIRFGQQLYCDGLGITPEEIGLTYTGTISRAAVILIALAAPLVFFVSFLLMVAIVEGTNWFSTIVEYLALILCFIIAAAVLAAANMVLNLSLDFGTIFLISVGLTFATGLVLIMVEWSKRRTNLGVRLSSESRMMRGLE